MYVVGAGRIKQHSATWLSALSCPSFHLRMALEHCVNVSVFKISTYEQEIGIEMVELELFEYWNVIHCYDFNSSELKMWN